MKKHKKTRRENLESKGFRVTTSPNGIGVENVNPRLNTCFPGLNKTYRSVTQAHKAIFGY